MEVVDHVPVINLRNSITVSEVPLDVCWRLPTSPLSDSNDASRHQGGGRYFMNHEKIRKRMEYRRSILPGSIPGCHLYFRREGGEWKYIG